MKAVIPTNYQIIMEKSGSTITWEMRETSAYKVLNRGTMAVSDLEILATFVEDHGVAKNLLEASRPSCNFQRGPSNLSACRPFIDDSTKG